MVIMRRKILRSKVFWGVVFIAAAALLYGLWQRSFKPGVIYCYNLNPDNTPVLLVGQQGKASFNYTAYSLETLSAERERISLKHDLMTIFPKYLGEEDGAKIFSFTVADHNVIREFPEVRYSGEETLMVARGVDWYMQFIWMRGAGNAVED